MRIQLGIVCELLECKYLVFTGSDTGERKMPFRVDRRAVVVEDVPAPLDRRHENHVGLGGNAANGVFNAALYLTGAGAQRNLDGLHAGSNLDGAFILQIDAALPDSGDIEIAGRSRAACRAEIDLVTSFNDIANRERSVRLEYGGPRSCG